MNRILFQDYVAMNNEIHFFEAENGIPAKMDVNSGKVMYIGDINGYKLDSGNACVSILNGRKIYSFHNSGESMMVYNIDMKRCCYIPISCGKENYGNFVYWCEYNEDLFVFPRYKKEILWVKTDEDTIKYVPTSDIISSCGIKIENVVWIFPKEGNQVTRFDLITKSFELYSLKLDLEEVVACCNMEKTIYILNRYGIIYVLNTESGKIEKLSIVENEHNNANTVGKILCVAGKLIIFPLADDNISLLDLNTREVEVHSEYPNDFLYYDDVLWSKYFGITEDKEFYYLLRKSNYLLKVKKDTGVFSWVKILIPKGIEKIMYGYGVVEFNEKAEGADFVSIIKEMGLMNKNVNVKNGNKIWEQLS